MKNKYSGIISVSLNPKRRLQRKLLQDIHRHIVIDTKKRYNRRAEKAACRNWE